MNKLVLISELTILIGIIFLGIYDWLYTRGLRRTSSHWGIIFPEKIEKLIILSRKVLLLSLIVMIIIIVLTIASP